MNQRVENLAKIEMWVNKRINSRVLDHSVESAIAYYQRFSPHLFEDVSNVDVAQLIEKMNQNKG